MRVRERALLTQVCPIASPQRSECSSIDGEAAQYHRSLERRIGPMIGNVVSDIRRQPATNACCHYFEW